MPSVGDPLDRQVGVEQVLTYRSEPLRADHRLHGVAGEREGPVNGTGRDTVIGRQVFEAYGSLPVQARPTAPHRQLWGSVRAASRLSPPGMVVPPRAEIIANSACRSGVPLLAGPGERGRPERATTHRGLLRKRSRLYRHGHSPPPNGPDALSVSAHPPNALRTQLPIGELGLTVATPSTVVVVRRVVAPPTRCGNS